MTNDCQCAGRPCGVTDASIAACSITSELHSGVSFSVDEDTWRVGHPLMGLLTVGPAAVPLDSIVFTPVSIEVAEWIITGCHSLPVEFRVISSN